MKPAFTHSGALLLETIHTTYTVARTRYAMYTLGCV